MGGGGEMGRRRMNVTFRTSHAASASREESFTLLQHTLDLQMNHTGPVSQREEFLVFAIRAVVPVHVHPRPIRPSTRGRVAVSVGPMEQHFLVEHPLLRGCQSQGFQSVHAGARQHAPAPATGLLELVTIQMRNNQKKRNYETLIPRARPQALALEEQGCTDKTNRAATE